MQDNPNGGNVAAVAGTALAAVAAGLAAIWKITSTMKEPERGTSLPTGSLTDRADLAIAATWRLIDELEAENKRLRERLRDHEEQLDQLRATVDELMRSRGRRSR